MPKKNLKSSKCFEEEEQQQNPKQTEDHTQLPSPLPPPNQVATIFSFLLVHL